MIAEPKSVRLSGDDLHLFNEGSHLRIYEKLGAHPGISNGTAGTFFAVWAPSADHVSVLGDWNGWTPGRHMLSPEGSSGIWQGFVPSVGKGAHYKYHVASSHGGYRSDRADPVAFHSEVSPKTASVVWDLDCVWGDSEWMVARGGRNSLKAPVSIYEVHLGSWMRVPAEGNRSLSYREAAPRLAAYAREQGFTHVQLLPIMEHPFFGSWGYQTTGYFAPSSCFGTPQDFMHFVDILHQHGIGVLLDWVPSHFATDGHGLGYFDGTHLYEHADPRQGFHPDWGSNIFNYGRNEVRSFLLSSALYWFDRYHIDGMRVDAVASMLYLDYSRKEGEWIPNRFGGRENLDAISFLRRLNEEVYRAHPDVLMIAEESTSWPMVSRPTYLGGLGFGLKWDMGWMHDSLRYMSKNAIHRRWHHTDLTFRMLYAFHENFVLPLSHDEVVHGKGSLLGKMSGDDWQKFANLRLLLGWMFAQAGKKLLFMGAELAQWEEWNHDGSIPWHVLEHAPHSGAQRWVRDLNHAYRNERALHVLDCEPHGFSWVDCNDADSGVVSLLRHSDDPGDPVLVIANFTPVVRKGYRVGVPKGGYWRELLNSDGAEYGGSGVGNAGGIQADSVAQHGHPCSLRLTLPPLAILYMRPAS